MFIYSAFKIFFCKSLLMPWLLVTSNDDTLKTQFMVDFCHLPTEGQVVSSVQLRWGMEELVSFYVSNFILCRFLVHVKFVREITRFDVVASELFVRFIGIWNVFHLLQNFFTK